MATCADHGGDPDPSNTVLTALSLAATGHDQATFESIMGWLAGHVDQVTGTGTDVDPGSTGYLMLVVAAAHDDATDFGGVDLVARLGSTLGLFEPGLYGSYASVGDPTYSGVFEQSLALLGLKAVGATESSAAIDWLVAQQCGGGDEFNGAWMSYRAPATPPATGLSPCTAFNSDVFTGIDTNSTSLAFEALDAVGRAPTYDGLAWLSRTQNLDGSFGFYVGNDGDPNSTALVVQAIVAGGEAPGSGRWVKGSDSPAERAGVASSWAATRPRPTGARSPSRAPAAAPTCWAPSRGRGVWPRPPSRSATVTLHRRHPCRASRPRPRRARLARRPRRPPRRRLERRPSRPAQPFRWTPPRPSPADRQIRPNIVT